MLKFRNDEVVARFCATWSVPRAAARQVFADLVRYLWLLATTGDSIGPVPVVDEMWHTFLLFSAEYRAFCERYFGSMLDHVPTTTRELKARRRLRARSPKQARREAAERIERDVSLVFDQLGERVARRWYISYADRYAAVLRRT